MLQEHAAVPIKGFWWLFGFFFKVTAKEEHDRGCRLSGMYVLVSPLHLTEDQRAPHRAAISMEPCSFCKTGTQAADLFE